MRVTSIIALIIALISLLIGSYTLFIKVNEIKIEQRKITEDILRLEQEISKPTQHGVQSETTEWPKYHDARGILKQIKGNRVIIDQDEMPGFMRAMVMSYDVEKMEQLKRLEEGDKVKLRLRETETDLTVVDIEKQ